ncbi:MAG: hypothetical protein JWL75_359 [Parcubacteria group bacterium]|nr:hypothetical protein [Parcubacteria group bacterium]
MSIQSNDPGQGNSAPDAQKLDLFMDLVEKELDMSFYLFDVKRNSKESNFVLSLYGIDAKLGTLNLFQQCADKPVEEWPAIIRAYLTVALKELHNNFESLRNIGTYEAEKDSLRIAMYPESHFASSKTRIEDYITLPQIPGIYAMLVIARGQLMRLVKHEEVASWNESFQDLVVLGLENTSSMTKVNVSDISSPFGKSVFLTGDNPLIASLAFSLADFNAVGIYGSLLILPTSECVAAYPIEIENVKNGNAYLAYADFAKKANELYEKGPKSLSPKVYWYQTYTFTELPYTFTKEGISLLPADEFIQIINSWPAMPDPRDLV